MLSPKKVKWRKQQKGRMKGQPIEGIQSLLVSMHFRHLNVVILQTDKLKLPVSRSQERPKGVVISGLKFSQISHLLKKPAEVRMGKGKGSPEKWVAVIKPGRVLFEVGGIETELAKDALKLARYKLPVKTKIISKRAVVILAKLVYILPINFLE